ncbi:MAG: hypothetical protein AAGF85_18635 [Bacteroidota bacterium]
MFDEARALITYSVLVSNNELNVLDLLVINTKTGSSNFKALSLIVDGAWLKKRGSFTSLSGFSGQVEVVDLKGKVWIFSRKIVNVLIAATRQPAKTASCETWINVDWTEMCVERTCTISEIIITEYELYNEVEARNATKVGCTNK